MEKTEIKKVKMADEKYCSECGEIIKVNAEICPKCGVRQVAISDVIENSKPNDKKIGEKFLFSSGTSLVTFLILIFMSTPQNSWLNGIIGSFMFALVAGILGMAIPTTKKIIYIPVSLAVMFLIAVIIGLSTN